jgi:serine phosphatase RsbU (regulator of sigma subunit)
MASCRAAVRALSAADLPPSELIGRLDQLLADDLSPGRFITMIYGILSADGGFTYANAGHGPAFLITSTGSEELASHRTPLGIVLAKEKEQAASTWQTKRTLVAGDRVLLASDGLSDAMNGGGEYFGVAAIEKIASDRGVSCDVVVKQLEDAMNEHTSGHPRTDDVTILCVDRLPAA